jgi:hypothetical protein
MDTPKHTVRKLAIEHVVYEYANLVSAGHYSKFGDVPWRTHADDAFLLGYRKLSDFLTRSDRYKDDIMALDFLPKGSKPFELPTWRDWSKHMNKQLAHLAYARIYDSREWEHRSWVPEMIAEFRRSWTAFLEAIQDDEYKQEFEAHISKCQAKPGFSNISLR